MESDDRMRVTHTLAPEDELVLLLCPRSLPDDVGARTRLLIARDFAWPRFVAQARRNGVLPLVTRALATLDFHGVPSEVQAQLEAHRRLNAGRNALLVSGLVRALRVLGSAGIPGVPLKGVALAESLYGDTALRECSDLDLLVPRVRAIQALRILAQEGYEHGQEPRVEGKDVGLLLESDIEYALVGRSGNFFHTLELHWDVAWRWSRGEEALEDLWAEVTPGRFSGVEIRELSREWRLLYLAVHAARHRWQSLKWLVDVHEVCVHDAPDWHRVWAKANRFGWDEALRVTLGACQALFRTPVPAGSPPPGAVPAWVSLFPATPVLTSIWQDALLPARLLRGARKKLGYAARVLFVPTLADRRLLRLPLVLGGLYYPLRPLRLGGKWGLGMLRTRLGGRREVDAPAGELGDRPAGRSLTA